MNEGPNDLHQAYTQHRNRTDQENDYTRVLQFAVALLKTRLL